ncbi:MAG: PAS domain S-box protein [Desulfuromonadaceae bacterium]|nr:PAS domain S-box protein [Desulfuromonadaceae bacterium]
MFLYLEGSDPDREAAQALLQEHGFNVSLQRGDNTASAGLFETVEKDLPLAFLEHSIDGLVILDAETAGVKYANNAFAEMLGYSLEEIRKLKVWDWDVVWSREEIEGIFSTRNWPGERFETRHRRKNGQLLDVDISQKPIAWRGIEVVFCVVKDITERKKTERALPLAQFTVENSGDQAFWITPEGRFFYVNQAACTALGYNREKLEGMAIWDIDPHVTRENADVYWRQVKENGLMRFETMHRAKDGRIYPVEIRGNYANFDGKEFSCAFVTDISERRQAEQQLRQANLVLENSPAVVFRWGVSDDWPVEMVSRNVIQFGYTSEELLSGAVSYAALVHPDDLDPLVAELHVQIDRGEEHFQHEYRIVTKQGEVRWVDERTLIERDAGGRVCAYQGVVMDISERKQAEEALEKRLVALTRPLDDVSGVTFEELFNPADIQRLQDDFAQATGVASLITLPDGTPLTESSNFCRLCDMIRSTEKGTANCMVSDAALGQPSASGPIIQQCLSAGLWGAGAAISVGGRHIANWLIGQVQDESITEEQMRAYARVVDADEEAVVEAFLEVPIMTGERFSQVAQALYTLARQLSTIAYQNVHQARIITDHRQAEEAVRKSECKYRSIIENAPFGITRSTREGKLHSVNPALASILKYDSAQQLKETIDRSSIQEILFPRPSEREPLVENILSGDAWYVFNNRLRCKDGSFVTCRVHSRRILDENGQASDFESYQENITEQLVAEQALRESEEKFRVLAETSPVAICLYEGEHLTYANPAMERMFGYSVEELCQRKLWNWVHEDHKELVLGRAMARLAGELVPSQYEIKCVTRDGEEKYIMVSAGTMSHQGHFSGVASFLDITERKRSEELVRASLAEKEVLLKEIHHRVKNNLQVVSSLLFLQSQKFSDAELKNCFLESQSRICSMALAHEQLYQSKNLAEVSVKSYLESLVEQLLQIFFSPGQEVDCRLEVEDIPLDIEKMVPCGLLITELLSNAYKHAFEDGQRGQVTISMQGGAGQIELAVADNGVGFPEELDYRQAKTFGLQLVTALVNQLGGTLEMESDAGTCFRVCFAE